MLGILCAIGSVFSFTCLAMVLKKHIRFVGSESVFLTLLYLLPTLLLVPVVNFSELSTLSLWDLTVISGIAIAWSFAEWLHVRSLKFINASSCQLISSLRIVTVLALSIWVVGTATGDLTWVGVVLVVLSVGGFVFFSSPHKTGIVIGVLRSGIMAVAVLLEKTMSSSCGPLTLSFLVLCTALLIYGCLSLRHWREYVLILKERPIVLVAVAVLSTINEACWYAAITHGEIVSVNSVAMTVTVVILAAEISILKAPVPDKKSLLCYALVTIGGIMIGIGA